MTLIVIIVGTIALYAIMQPIQEKIGVRVESACAWIWILGWAAAYFLLF